MELFAFTREYVENLREGDPSTEQHFVAYFDQILRIKLRARMLALETMRKAGATAREMLISVRSEVQGAQISAPLGRYSSAADVLEALGTRDKQVAAV